jgi:two-component system sensor histidine kinase YesM
LLKVAVCPSRDALARGFQAIVVAFRVPFLDRVADPADDGVEELFLVDAEGRIVLSGEPGNLGSPVEARRLEPGVFRHGRRTWVTASAAIPSADWRLVSVTDFSRLTRDVEELAAMALWALVALVAGFGVYIEVFFRQVLRPIRALVTNMGRVEQGDWSVRVPVVKTPELSHLGAAFNAMIAQMERLTTERERQERERARLEVKALRLQINPHFLTNTLNSIRMLAAISNAEPIRRMTAALMRVVSSAFRGTSAFATIEEELEILEQYLFIMRVRYGDTFDVLIEVAPELRGLGVLRMLLQPLVENAVLHGLQGLDRRGEIGIRGRLEDGVESALVLEVSDNGKGVPPERFASALCTPPEGHHGMTSIGLANIQRRIALNHGAAFGIELVPPRVGGTTIRLRLPALRWD